MKDISKYISGAAVIMLAFSAGAATVESQPLKAQTKKNLEAAMHGEAYAHLKYKAYAEQARESGQPEIARLFEESANVEANEHFAREADALGLAKGNEANLLDGMAGEYYENTKMNVDFANQADKAGDTRVAAMFRQIAADEGDHYQSYKLAVEKLRESKK